MGLSGVDSWYHLLLHCNSVPKYTILDQTYSETRSDVDSRVYGVASGGGEQPVEQYMRLV